MAGQRPQIFVDPPWDGSQQPQPIAPGTGSSVFADVPTDAPPPMPKVSMPGPVPVFADAPGPHVTPPPTPIQAQLGETDQRLRKLQTQDATPFGSPTNHPGVGGKILHALSVAGNIAGDIFAPATMSLIPGTQANRTVQENNLSGRLQELGQENSAEEEKAAQTKNLDLQPQLKAQQLALNQEKQNEKEENDKGKLHATLAQHGFALDETNPGQLRPLRYEEMSPTQQAVSDLKNAQQEQAEATAALRQAQNDPSSPTFKLAQGRLDVARRNAQTAIGRLGLSGQQFELRAHGTENGQALAGSMIDDEGKPVGTAFQGNVRPTGQERNKGDMAFSAEEQLGDIKSIMQKHPDLFGPGFGQASKFRQWLGSEDPDAQRFLSARTIAADHLAGTFGGRSEAALDALDSAIGQFKDNPAAAIAGIDQLTKANTRFEKAGTVRTTGSKPPTAGAPAGVQALTDGGVTYHIPSDQVEAFKKDHPNAR